VSLEELRRICATICTDLESDVFGDLLPAPGASVEIPKPHGGGVRMLGVPTIADRIAQTVVARHLESRWSRSFTPTPMATARGGRRWTRLGVPAALLAEAMGH